MSIPNRFIESFMADTAILTDKLRVKWYKPFGAEVVETVEMGYLPKDKVEWDKFKKDISSLPKLDKGRVIMEFWRKWCPEVFAWYVIDTVIDAVRREKP